MPMPDVVGDSYREIRDQLQQPGAVVRLELMVRPGTEAGTVLASTPAAGESIPAVALLDVADLGEAIWQSDVYTEDSVDCRPRSSVGGGWGGRRRCGQLRGY